MCTIGALIQGDRTFMLKNFDYRPFPTGWVLLESFDHRYPHFALVNHNQRGLNSGLNGAGMGLQISYSGWPDPFSPGTEELRTVLNGEVLSRFAAVEEAVPYIETCARLHPEMMGGNVMLADGDRISVTEYFGGEARSEIQEEGFLARANHSRLGVVKNGTENSLMRYETMAGFLEELHSQLAELDREEIIARCRQVLRADPLLRDSTRSSFVIDVQERRVDYVVGRGSWQTFRFAEKTAE